MMPHANATENIDAIRAEWLDRLLRLVDDIEAWAASLDWTTKRIDKPMKDSLIGAYRAPGLLMQKDFTRVILDPIARATSGSEGLVDLYLMPAFDDIANLYFDNGRWNVHYGPPHAEVLPNGDGTVTIHDALAQPLTKETLADVLDKLLSHAA